MMWIADVLEDVPLADPHVLQLLPGRVGDPAWLLPPEVFGHVGYRLLEADMCIAALEQVQHVISQRLVVRHFRPPFHWAKRSLQGPHHVARSESLPCRTPRQMRRPARAAPRALPAPPAA